MQGPKNQHYIPQFYLKGFANHINKDKWTVFLLDKEKQEIRVDQNIENVCSENYLYSYKDGGAYDFSIENELAKKESEYAESWKDIIVSLEHHIKWNYQRQLTYQQKTTLLKFICNLIVRGKNIHNMLDNIMVNGFTKISERNGENQTTADIMNDVKKLAYPNWFVNNGRTDKLISILERKKWCFWYIDKNVDASFLSSDDPVLQCNPDRTTIFRGLISPTTEISIPLNSKLAITLHEQWPKQYQIQIVDSVEKVKKMNGLFIKNAERYVYSDRKDMLLQ